MVILLLTHFSPNIRAELPHFPQAVPLAVRSPYFTTWNYFPVIFPSFLNSTTLATAVWPPTTFNESQIIGWTVFVRVDGLAYVFLGYEAVVLNGYVDLPPLEAPTGVSGAVNFTNIVVTPTQTMIVAHAGPMQVNLTFLIPIEPKDWVKQSIPFSYMAFTAKSSDGASHAVQVYSDVSGEWNSGDINQEILWNTTSNADVPVVYHSVTLKTPAPFTEIIDQAEWGTLYYAMQTGENVTYKTGVDLTTTHIQFAANGTLDNQEDQNFRPISQNTKPVFAISRDLGTIQFTQAPVVWTVGFTTDPAVNYTDLSGAPPTSRSPYYKTQYSTDEALIIDFLKDFSNASSRAQQLDQVILQNAASVSNMLGDLVSFAIAQVYGSTQLTIGTDASGNFNNSDVMMFMKNLGGVQAGRVNPVEVLYAAFPAFMYIDPTLGAPLLEPLFRLQASPNYTIPFATADLGSVYPTISGSNSNHSQGVEQSGNMLIMTYAYARASGDGSLISRYYSLLTSWADYLINSTLFIYDQSSADGLTVSDQTNLAIKGIIAIEAMSKMSSVVKQTSDENKYSSAAGGLYGQWKSLSLGSDQHLLVAYGQSDSWTLGYNLFADVWLGTSLVEPSVYKGQSNFVETMMSDSTFGNFGIPVDSLDTSVAYSSWSLFAAAMTSNEDLRSQLISKVHNLVFYNMSGGVFPVNYSSASGTVAGTSLSSLVGVASPAQGAVFAPLALKAPVLNINPNGTVTTAAVATMTSSSSSSSHTKSNTPAIAGGIVGAAAAILSVIGVVVFVRRRRRQGGPRPILSNSMEDVSITPFSPIPSEATLPVDRGTDLEPFPPSQQPVAPLLAGASGKEIARLRRLRARVLNSQPSHNPAATLNVSQSMPSLNALNESGGATSSYDPRRLQSEVESLRREMERLRSAGLATGAPPSYTEGGG